MKIPRYIVIKLEMVGKDTVKATEITDRCEVYEHETDEDKPQTETQTETQNSNLTFEKRTMRDCYNCKRYENDCECRECNYEPKDETQTIRCPKCGRTDYIRDMEKDMGIKGSHYKYKCINCNTYIKDDPQTDCSWRKPND